MSNNILYELTDLDIFLFDLIGEVIEFGLGMGDDVSRMLVRWNREKH